MSIDAMRSAILKAYNYAPKWVEKVAQMSSNQIIAVYYSFLKRGKV